MKKFVPILIGAFLLLVLVQPAYSHNRASKTKPTDISFSWHDLYQNGKEAQPASDKKRSKSTDTSGKPSFRPASKLQTSLNGKTRYMYVNK